MQIKYKNNKNKYTLVSNIIIILIFSVLILFTSTGNINYVFNYENENVIYNGNKNSKKVSLMINVYWGSEYIEQILNVFKKHGIKTTFFVGGQWAQKEPELLSKIINDGHEIGNHGYFHEDHSKLTYEQNHEEIVATHNLIKVIYNLEMNLFAPPSGAFNKSTLLVAEDLGYKTIMWSRDTIDWRDHDVNLIIQRATKNISGGELILMHPTNETLKALPTILEYYLAVGIKPTTVTECLI